MPITVELENKILVLNDKYGVAIKLLMVYCEFLAKEDFQRLEDFFRLPIEQANLASLNDLIRPDIFFKSLIQHEMQEVFELLVKYKNSANNNKPHRVSNKLLISGQNPNALSTLLKAIFLGNREIIEVIVKDKMGEGIVKQFSIKLQKIAENNGILREMVEKPKKEGAGLEPPFAERGSFASGKKNDALLGKEAIEEDFIEVDASKYKLSSLETVRAKLDMAVNILEKNMDVDSRVAFLKKVFVIFTRFNHDRTAQTLSYGQSFSTFLSENAILLNNPVTRLMIDAELVKLGFNDFTRRFIFHAADTYNALNELTKQQCSANSSESNSTAHCVSLTAALPEEPSQLLSKTLGVMANLKKILRAALLYQGSFNIKNQAKLSFEDIALLLKTYITVKSFSKEAVQLYQQNVMVQTSASAQHQAATGGLLYAFNSLASKAFSSITSLQHKRKSVI
jgi:hypothetical protein